MLLTPHVLVGISIAAATKNPYIAVPVAFASHFVGDLVPHWDFYSEVEDGQEFTGWRPIAVMADLVLGVAFGLSFTLYALWVLKDPVLAIGIFGSGIAAVAPDALMAPAIYNKVNPNKFSKLILKIQSKLQFQAPLPWGMLTQLLVSFSCLLLTSYLLKQ